MATSPGRLGPCILLAAVVLAGAACSEAPPRSLEGRARLDRVSERVERYQVHETVLRVDPAPAGNPFTDAELRGRYHDPAGRTLEVAGFCDSEDGSTYRIRFLPRTPGRHTAELTFATRDGRIELPLSFEVVAGTRPGPVTADPDNPRRLMLESGEHPYFVSKTAWLLFGTPNWREFIDQAAENGFNVLRAGIECDYYHGTAGIDVWPWAGTRDDPDFSRFDLATWRRIDEIFSYAASRGVWLEPVIFTSHRGGAVSLRHLFGTLPDRRMEAYWRYLMARLAAYPNVVFFQLYNEFKWRKGYQEHMARTLERHNPFGRLITTSWGTTDGPIWPDEDWNDLSLNHSCTSSNPERHGLESYYYRVGLAVAAVPKPGWIDESGRRRHGNHDPVYRRKEYWVWSLAGVYWNYHSDGGCDRIREMPLGPGEEYVRPIRSFWEGLDEWWRLAAAPDLIADHAGVDHVFAAAGPGRERFVLYLANATSGSESGEATVRLAVPAAGREVRFYVPETGRYLERRGGLEPDGDGRSLLRAPAFRDDLVAVVDRSAERVAFSVTSR